MIIKMNALDSKITVNLPQKKALQLLTSGFTEIIEFDKTKLKGCYDPRQSESYRLIEKKLEMSKKIMDAFSQDSPFINEADLKATMELILQNSKLDGFMVVTWDAFPVLEVFKEGCECSEIFAAIGVLLTDIVKRAEQEAILGRPDELTMWGLDGQFIIVRYFQNLEWQFILMAFARKKCPYRHATNCVMQLCEPILADFVYI